MWNVECYCHAERSETSHTINEIPPFGRNDINRYVILNEVKYLLNIRANRGQVRCCEAEKDIKKGFKDKSFANATFSL